MESNDDELDALQDAYGQLCREFYRLEDHPPPRASERETYARLVDEFMKCSSAVKGLGLFVSGRHREWDDLSTKSLQFLLIPFYVGSLFSRVSQAATLLRAKSLLSSFVADCEKLSIEESQEDSSDARVALRANARRKERLVDLQEKFDSHAAVSASHRISEEDIREFFKLRILVHQFDAKRMLKLIEQEMELLRFGKQQGLVPGGQTDKDVRFREERDRDMQDRLASSLPPTVIDRERIRREVFVDRNPYSVTVEQWADVEMERLRGREAASRAATVQRSSESHIMSSEEADEEARKKQSNWDDWKDDHPRGAGNTLK